jgi:hypothetical protein
MNDRICLYVVLQVSRWSGTTFTLVLIAAVFTSVDIIQAPFFLWSARIIAQLCLVFQTALLVDASTLVNSKLLAFDHVGEGWSSAKLFILFMCAGMFALVMFQFYSATTQEYISVAVSICLMVAFIYCQLFQSDVSNLLSSSVVACYVTHLTVMGVSRNPNPSSILGLVECLDTAGLLLLIVAPAILIYSDETSKVLTKQTNYGAVEVKEGDDEEDENDANTSNYHATFCFWMALISCAYTMNLVSYVDTYDEGGVMMWGYVGTGWLAALLYMWVLLAPRLCPDRSF